jgi:NAD(P)-dependent dehydrogenase (short-subunit alcohol dehydrogenase family)
MARLAKPRRPSGSTAQGGDGALSGRVAIVTGAARGIGLAAALALAEAGARVLMTDIDASELKRRFRLLAHDRPALAQVPADVSKARAVRRMVAQAISLWGRLDILINNAAIPDSTPFDQLSEKRWRQVMSINLDSIVHCVRAALPHLRRSPSASIVNVASTQGILGQPNALAYGAAKGAVVNLTRCMAVDFGPVGVRVNAIAPGFIDTRMALLPNGGGHEHETAWFKDIYLRYGKLPLRRPGKPEDVAGAIVFLAGDQSRYVTGQVLAVDGGLTCTY